MRPILFEFFGGPLYAYHLFMGLAWGFAYQSACYYLLKDNMPLKGFRVLFWGVFISSWFGAKIFFLIYSAGPKAIDYLQASAFWLGGGFVFYGGLFFGVFYVLFYCLVLKRFDLFKIHLFLPAVCFGHAIGRLGCFFTGCCYGTHCSLPWAIDLHGGNGPRHPVQLYESFSVMALGLLMVYLIKRKSHHHITILLTYFTGYASLRFILEFFRGDRIRGKTSLWGFSPSQNFSLGLLIFAAILLTFFVRKKRDKSY